jgi:hypothetical protein
VPLKKWKDVLNTTMLMFSKTLEPDEWAAWGKILEPLPSKAMGLAFENWQRNGKFFPKPKDILDLVEVYKTEHRVIFRPCGNCSDGWIVVTEGAKWRDKDGNLRPVAPGNKAVRRCECFVTWAAGQRA